jgi:hypothetical protein
MSFPHGFSFPTDEQMVAIEKARSNNNQNNNQNFENNVRDVSRLVKDALKNLEKKENIEGALNNLKHAFDKIPNVLDSIPLPAGSEHDFLGKKAYEKVKFVLKFLKDDHRIPSDIRDSLNEELCLPDLLGHFNYLDSQEKENQFLKTEVSDLHRKFDESQYYAKQNMEKISALEAEIAKLKQQLKP